MPVFISYQQSDRNDAIMIGNYLRSQNIEYYLDVLDAESRNARPEEITRIITENVAKSTHLIAVTSHSTDASWWVPFEIGEATITDSRIATYRVQNTSLPEYLEQWPAMRHPNDLIKFVEAYRADRRQYRFTESFESYGTARRSDRATTARATTADDFHRALKQKLSQY